MAQAILMAKFGQAIFWLLKLLPIRGEKFGFEAKIWL